MSNPVVDAKFCTNGNAEAAALFGNRDENLRLVERLLGCKIIARANEVTVSGPEEAVGKAVRVLGDLQSAVRAGNRVSGRETRYSVMLAHEERSETLSGLLGDVVQVTARGKQIRPRTIGQKQYIDAIKKNDIVFGIGPAGTGKTYLAMAMAIAAFKNKQVSRIVLTRPAVEAGEKLGFLPGDLQEKVDPYLRPLYDALFDMLGLEVYERYREKGLIEIAPLAYMRGRTLDDAFIILDEAQNTTPEQMKMFLTRLGFSSKAVVTGDITQIDLPRRRFSGLEEVQTVLSGIEGIEFAYLTDQDVVRHELVQKVVRAYERFDSRRAKEPADKLEAR
ncbi:MAG: PhoH family protein [Clostridia bacterium]|nr:PhoH family protein [Clostridia bacterium]